MTRRSHLDNAGLAGLPPLAGDFGGDFYRGKRILVTGGTGSIGSQIVEQALAAGADVVRILSRDETKQLELEERLARHLDLARVRFLIGDVRDAARLSRAMEGIEIAFHAAAMKHVPACEYNPFEAVQTNVLGTQNVITSAREAGVARLVVISTDKATCPENTLGATKLLAERLVAAAHLSSPGLNLSAVRFGNVIGSRGSLAPRVLRQLEEEGCASLTHADMTRFMMTLQDAVSLVLEAGSRGQGGEIFILKMPVLRVLDLIEVLVEEHAARRGKPAGEFPIRVVGIRSGEKLHEILITDDEARRTHYDPKGLFVIEPLARAAVQDAKAAAEFQERLDSSRGPYLTRGEIRGLLSRGGVIAPLRKSSKAGSEAPAPRVVELLGKV
ncbi:MAG: SDR family NAD(P)-dependent oxidoreductase [Planctomycetes bacterium]|nr:SDR family NAD(P)-dependent oxidoreductase [Planctomycetota bacterium]